MKRILIVAVASMMAASRALAADLPAVATVYNWGGGYIGINGGYGFGQSEWGNDPLNPSGNNSSGNFNVNGGLVGGTIGVGGQWGAFVLGVEGDFDWQGYSRHQQQQLLHQPHHFDHPQYQRQWCNHH